MVAIPQCHSDPFTGCEQLSDRVSVGFSENQPYPWIWNFILKVLRCLGPSFFAWRGMKGKKEYVGGIQGQHSSLPSPIFPSTGTQCHVCFELHSWGERRSEGSLVLWETLVIIGESGLPENSKVSVCCEKGRNFPLCFQVLWVPLIIK